MRGCHIEHSALTAVCRGPAGAAASMPGHPAPASRRLALSLAQLPSSRRCPHREKRAGAHARRRHPARRRLSARLRPARIPALLQRTPYSKNDRDAARRFSAIAARGYVVVVQDTRGRYMSDGVARPARRGRRRLRFGAVGGLAAGGERQGRHVRRQLSGDDAAPGGDPAAAGARRALSRLVLQPAPRHGVPGWRVLSERRARLESRPGDGCAAPRADAGRRSRRPDRARRRRRARCCDRRGSGTCRSSRSTSSSSIASRRATGRCSRTPTPTRFWAPGDIEAHHDKFLVPAFHLTGWYDTLLTGTLRNFTRPARACRRPTARGDFSGIVIGPWTHARPTTRDDDASATSISAPDAGFDSDEAMLQLVRSLAARTATARPSRRRPCGCS